VEGTARRPQKAKQKTKQLVVESRTKRPSSLFPSKTPAALLIFGMQITIMLAWYHIKKVFNLLLISFSAKSAAPIQLCELAPSHFGKMWLLKKTLERFFHGNLFSLHVWLQVI